MSYLIETGDNDVSTVAWPQRCGFCDCGKAECTEPISGTCVVATTGSYTAYTKLEIFAPCCNSCSARAKWLAIVAVVIMVLPWIGILIGSMDKAAYKLLNDTTATMVCASMGVGMALLAYRYWFVRGIRIYSRGQEYVGLVFRDKKFADETARLNGLRVTKKFGLVGW